MTRTTPTTLAQPNRWQRRTRADQLLTEAQKAALIAVYDSMLRD
jgi:hypothetical protein